MRSLSLVVVAVFVFLTTVVVHVQTGPTDVYSVTFVKALPGQTEAVAKSFLQQDAKDPMAAHFVLLRHQEGDDWDYVRIQHVGKQATVAITPIPPPPAVPSQAWHYDAFVAGPSWGEFSKIITGPPTSVFVVSVHRQAPGKRAQLLEMLRATEPGVKVPISQTTMEHIEGGPWTFLNLVRYNSWADLAAHRSGVSSGTGWADIRQHTSYHVDTIADRVQ